MKKGLRCKNVCNQPVQTLNSPFWRGRALVYLKPFIFRRHQIGGTMTLLTQFSEYLITLINIGRQSTFWHENIGFQASPSSIGSRRAASIARPRNDHFPEAEFPDFRDSGRYATHLEQPGRIAAIIFKKSWTCPASPLVTAHAREAGRPRRV